MTVPGGITGPCNGGGTGSGLGIGIGIGICTGEFLGMTGVNCCAGVIGPAAGGGCRGCDGVYCASGMDIVGAINGGAIWLAVAPSDGGGYWSRGRLLKRPRRVLRGRTLLYVVGC